MEFIRDNTYPNKVVLVDGCGGAGKILVSSILECLEGAEAGVEDENSFLISRLWRANKLTEDAAIAYLRLNIDRRIHYLMMGRCLNIKKGESISVRKYPNPLKYLKRHFNNEKYLAEEEVFERMPIFHTMTQNALTDIDLYLKAFGSRLSVIYIHRSSIDVIYDMYKRKFLDDIGIIPSNIRFTIKDEDGYMVPLFAADWSDEYIDMSDMEKVSRWILESYQEDMDAFGDLPKEQQKQIMFIDFDELVTNPYPICEQISEFLGVKFTHHLNRVLKRENCPRKIDYKERNRRREFINNHAN